MDMNIQFTVNPYETDPNVKTKGVTAQKVAKLNNTTKRPVLVANWEKGRPTISMNYNAVSEVKEKNIDYNALLEKIGTRAVSYHKSTKTLGAKKLRVNKIFIPKSNKIYNAVNVNMTPEEEVVDLINQISAPEGPATIKEEIKLDESYGRHGKTGEIPVDDIKKAIREEIVEQDRVISSRMERNASDYGVDKPELKQEPKATDMDLYNNLIHTQKESLARDEDVSRQLQGAKEELNIEKEESRKLAEQYGKAVRELEELKVDIENKKRLKAQQEKRELTETLNSIETLKRENLEKTSDLSSIQAEIAKLKAEKESMESVAYNNEFRSYGRRAA